jgi:hypothetical protein
MQVRHGRQQGQGRARTPPPAARRRKGRTFGQLFADGLLTQGVALLAWRAAYSESGVKSFMINHDGVGYVKDPGEETGAAAASIQVFDPDSSWSIVEPEEAS